MAGLEVGHEPEEPEGSNPEASRWPFVAAMPVDRHAGGLGTCVVRLGRIESRVVELNQGIGDDAVMFVLDRVECPADRFISGLWRGRSQTHGVIGAIIKFGEVVITSFTF
jgi:hypothetical protein